MNKIIKIVLILSLLLLVGCNNQTAKAYFDVGVCCEDKSMNELEVDCNKLCDESGLRLRDDQDNNKVTLKDCQYICKCL